MSTCSEPDFISVKSSPLVHLLRSLYEKFPGVDCESIDKIVIRSKCNVEVAEEEINCLVSDHSTFKDSNDTDSLTDWYSKENPVSSVAFPKREIKVYRLDADGSPKK